LRISALIRQAWNFLVLLLGFGSGFAFPISTPGAGSGASGSSAGGVRAGVLKKFRLIPALNSDSAMLRRHVTPPDLPTARDIICRARHDRAEAADWMLGYSA
jgi:hypothetical protein